MNENDIQPVGAQPGSPGSEIFLRGLLKLQRDTRVILCLPGDLCDLYKAPLTNRMKDFGVELVICEPTALPEGFSTFNRILAYQCDLPALGLENESDPEPGQVASASSLFPIAGAPLASEILPFTRGTNPYTCLESRFLELEKTTLVLEENQHFQNLVKFQQNIRSKLLSVSQKQVMLDQLNERIRAIDDGYYQVLSYYLQQAIDKVLQLFTLGTVMKKYVKILLIDDLGERSFEQLEELGFRKRFLSSMSLNTFHQKYREFKEKYLEQSPGTAVTHHDFLTKCAIFDDYEVVFFNPWKLDQEKMPVQFRLLKKAALTRKEIRKKNEDPEKAALKVNKLVKERQKLEGDLQTVEHELHTSEIKGNLTETAYVGLNKKRKRLLRNIQHISESLVALQKKVDDTPEISFHLKDFMLAFTDSKIVKSIQAQAENSKLMPLILKSDEIQTMAGLVKQKKGLEQQKRQLNAQVKIMLDRMAAYTKRYPLDSEKSYQQILGTYTLDILERAILGSGIACVNRMQHAYQGPYFQNRWGKSAVDWSDSLLSQASVFLASKNTVTDTAFLERFFRMESSNLFDRLEKSPALPRIVDFEDHKFDLFILNADSYPFQDLLDCLKRRYQLRQVCAPILILDPSNQYAASKHKTALDLLIGLKTDQNGAFQLEAPPYRISELNASEDVLPVLCAAMGVDEQTVPAQVKEMVSEDLVGDAWFSDQLGSTEQSDTSSVSDGVKASATDDRQDLPTGEKPSGHKIELSSMEEKAEEIYSLGSLFSFDDDTRLHSSVLPAETESSGTGPESAGEITVTEMSHEQADEGKPELHIDHPQQAGKQEQHQAVVSQQRSPGQPETARPANINHSLF